ncbi:MAG: hypothetical protein ACRDP6_36415 [Actinoallomurus sp.]
MSGQQPKRGPRYQQYYEMVRSIYGTEPREAHVATDEALDEFARTAAALLDLRDTDPQQFRELVNQALAK